MYVLKYSRNFSNSIRQFGMHRCLDFDRDLKHDLKSFFSLFRNINNYDMIRNMNET